MPYLNDRILDLGLNVLDIEANRLDICSAEPTTYTQATSTYTLGYKTSFAVGSPTNRSPSGREVAVTAFTDGIASANGTAIAWAITDTVNSRLLAAGTLTTTTVVSGNPFSLATNAIKVGMPTVGGS